MFVGGIKEMWQKVNSFC
uniref:Uncharacterized protein n=1 Tax=Rhizophora mucronata TaxID=61149 RepID=A0A2P2NAF3_RHIMU